jgi:hypothetical protein
MNTLFYSTLLALLLACNADPTSRHVVLGDDVKDYAILAASTVSIVNAMSCVVKGKVGLSPGSAITGVLPNPGTVDAAVPATFDAQKALGVAYEAAAGALCKDPLGEDVVCPIETLDLGDQVVGRGDGKIYPGIHKFAATASVLGKLTLVGDATEEFIFQIGSAVLFAANSEVVFEASHVNGLPPTASHVTWQVGSSATIMGGAQVVGNVLAYASITQSPGANVDGRLLAMNGAVTIDASNVGFVGGADAIIGPL